ncbi:MAG TPA: molybdopterin-dependent oxidoreductase [Actinomycetales bacterium]|nr:molybdopterin-dependent oxidoreductase [Actinomycetales bacterium]
MGPTARPFAALAGLLSGAATLATAELLAALISPTSAPLIAVGGAFVDLTPPWLKDFAIRTFGTHDKLVLTIAMVVVVGLLSAVAGVIAAWRWAVGALLVTILGLVAATAAATRPAAGTLDVAPALIGTVVGILVLRVLLNRLPDRKAVGDPRATNDQRATRDPDRREFLMGATFVTLGAAFTWAAARTVGGASRTVAAARQALRLPKPTQPAAPLPAGTWLTVPGLTPFITNNDDFYRVDTALAVPQVDATGWRLKVHGLVDREVVLGFNDLLSADLVETYLTLTCVSNEVGGNLAGNAKWLGYPIARVLGQAGAHPGADMVLSTSADGFTASTPLDVLLDGRDALLAIGMNGQPLPVAHGYPVRMVVPGLYGYVSATKWVVDLEVTRFADRAAYWTDRGWAPRGPVKTASRIDVPGRFDTVHAGRVTVAGVAWAQHRGIEAVEIRVDDDGWQRAQLAQVPGPDTWRQWWFPWDAAPGEHRLTVRAVDGTGQLQTSRQAPPAPDGASGWHTRSVTVT